MSDSQLRTRSLKRYIIGIPTILHCHPYSFQLNFVYTCNCRNDRNTKGVGDGDDGLRIRKFRQEDYHDDSEEDGTYNGNSTQQQ